MIWGTWISFVLWQLFQESSRLVMVFLGTLWSSIKEVKHLVFLVVEDGIALEALQGNQSSSCIEGGILWFHSNCGRKLVVPLE